MMEVANQLPEAWVLNLTKDELDLYSNLVPDYASGTVKSEFMLKETLPISEMELSDIIAFFRKEETALYDTYWFFEDDGITYLTLTGSTPLLDADERAVYDSLMVKIRARHREMIVERIQNCKDTIVRLEKELEEYVW